MSTEPFWDEQPDVFDTIIIAGATFANVDVDVSGAVGAKIDVKSPPNLDGARETPLGYEPARPVITFEIWHANHWLTWQRLLPSIRPRPGKTTSGPITISHPMLGAYDLEQFVVTKVHLPKKKGKGLYDLRIEALEYFPQPKPQGTQTPPAFVGATLPPIEDPVAAGQGAKPPSETNTGL